MFISPETYHFLEGLLQIGITLLLGGFALWVLCIKPRNRLAWDQCAHLVEPALSKIKERYVLFISIKGDPNKNAGPAYRKLFSAYYKLNPQTGPGAPLARWTFGTAPIPNRSNLPPMDQWIVKYALAISKKMKGAAEKAKLLPEIKVETWQAGEVAELLHEGPYDLKCGTVDKLHNFIKAEGYEIAGEPEEEYVYGPGSFFRGNPKTYLTIVRCPVRPTPEAVARRAKGKEEKKPGKSKHEGPEEAEEVEGEEEENDEWIIEDDDDEEEGEEGEGVEEEDDDQVQEEEEVDSKKTK